MPFVQHHASRMATIRRNNTYATDLHKSWLAHTRFPELVEITRWIDRRPAAIQQTSATNEIYSPEQVRVDLSERSPPNTPIHKDGEGQNSGSPRSWPEIRNNVLMYQIYFYPLHKAREILCSCQILSP